jgi:surface protein
MGYRGIVPFMSKIRPFIIEVKTDNAGTSSSDEFTIPTTGGGYSYTIRTSNGVTTGNTGNVTITWPIAGTYEIEIYGTFPRIFFNDGGDKLKLLKVKDWGTINWASFNSSFYGCSNMDVTATDVPDLSGVTSLESVFRSCTSLLNSNGSIGNWDVSAVTTMSSMFNTASAFNQNIGNWDVSAVADFTNMFNTASAFNQNIGNWDVSAVTDFTDMFRASVFNNGGSSSIGGWSIKTIGSVSFSGMFQSNSVFNQPIGTWNTSAVTSMSAMFNLATSFNQDIGAWDVSNVTTMSSMFTQASSFNNGGNSSIGGWTIKTSGSVSMQQMFEAATSFNQPIGTWDTGNVTNMSSMFKSANLFNQNIGAWDVSSVSNFNAMFRSAIAFNNGGSSSIGGWTIKTSGPVDMSEVFSSASAFNQTLVSWNTSEVTTFFQMFQGSPFNYDISVWNVSKATDMRFMFASTSAFNQNLSIWSLRLTGVLLNNIFSGSVMSTANYTDSIVGWANYVQTNSNTPDSVSMANQGGRIFQDSRSGGAGFANAAAARTYLTTAVPTGAGWTISGDTIIA